MDQIGIDLPQLSLPAPAATMSALPRHLSIVAVLAAVGTSPACALQASAGSAQAAIRDGLALTPQMFGAKGDGVTDDTAAVETWLKTGKPLFCSGVFRIARAIAVDIAPSGGVFLDGAGRQLCKFVLDTPAAGLTFHGGRPDRFRTPQIVIHDISLAPAAQLNGPALTIAFIGGKGATDPTIDLRNVAIRPVGDVFYAPVCLLLDNARGGTAEGINCSGPRAAYVAGTKGVVVTGDSAPVEVTLRDIDVYAMETAISLEGTWQGVSINEAVCVGCRIGVDATSTDNNSTWLRVNDSHFNVEDTGLRTVNVSVIDAFGNLIFLHDLGFSHTDIRACFDLRMTTGGPQWAKIANNTCTGIQAKTAAPKVGIVIDSQRPPSEFLLETRIDGNSFFKVDWGVYLKNTTAVALGNNTFAFMGKGDVHNGSNGTGKFQNTQAPPPVPIPPDGD